MTQIEDEQPERPPSKSSRKRAAHGLQKLGEQLIRMRDTELATLPLTEPLRDAITEARRLRSPGARSRQHQLIGKLMRDIDINALEAALAALTDAQNTRARMNK
jgi:ribosome-associated protein